MIKTMLVVIFATINFYAEATTYVGNFSFGNQSAIDNFPVSHPNCTEITGTLTLNGANITNVNGLNGLTSIGQNLHIVDCPSLTNINPLSNLTSVGGSLILNNNITLSDIGGLSNAIIWGVASSSGNITISIKYCALTNLNGLNQISSIPGNLEIHNNPQLINFNGLSNLNSIGGNLFIHNNASLVSLLGLNNLYSIGGYLQLTDNNLLSSLTALNNLTSINGYIAISNSSLTSLSGLDNINPLGITILNFQNNSLLSECAVASICSRLAMGGVNISGTNATGCSSNSQVTNACTNLPSILNLKLFLQALYSGSNLMSPSLMNQGILINSNISDSIIVELHSSIPPFPTIKSINTILYTNGSVSCSFSPSISGSYYIVVRHRNGVTTWSANPIAIGPIPTFYDFTSASSNAFGGNMKEVEIGQWAIYSGDLNYDNNIDLLDISALEIDVITFQSGYLATDLNGDGNVDLLDVSILEENVNNFIFSNHP